MNKKTRIFIFGLILAALGGIATAIHIIQMYYGEWKGDWFSWILFIGSAYCYVYGMIKVYSSITGGSEKK